MKKFQLKDIPRNINLPRDYVLQTFSNNNPFFAAPYPRFERELLNTKFDFDVYMSKYGKNLQRGFCWSLEKKIEYIQALFRGLRFPDWHLIRKENAGGEIVYQVIDGKQRISTILEFMRGEFSVEFYLAEETENFFYSDLDKDDIMAFKNAILRSQPCSIATYMGDLEVSLEIPDYYKREWFRFVSFTGEPQDEKHLKSLYE